MSSKLSLTDFMKDSKSKNSSAKHLDLKAKGKAIVFLHPDSGIYKRNTYWFPYYGEAIEDNKKVIKTYDLMIVCPGQDVNPISKLRKSLRENKDIDHDEVILKVGKGEHLVEYTKGDILGEEGYDWKKSLAYRTEYLFGVIDKDEPTEVHPFVAPKSLGNKITKVIEDQIEEEGEEDGNPFINPYAFKLSYNKSEQPANMYQAVWNKSKVTPEIEELLDGDGPDLKPLVEKTKVEKIAYLVREALAYDEDELGLDLSAADDFDPEELKPDFRNNDSEDKEEEKPKKKTSRKKKVEEEEEEEKPKKKRPSKKVVEPEPEEEEDDEDEEEDEEEEMIECPECGEEIPADSTECPECGEDVDPF